ncbi:uncharacterized protein LOC128218285 isoform X2 [Mya arenaria]|uniref:uncharacterized protein LOC128218285 isoform X2 n=1 Tax=Mya arenaria TaxID=6604 RepID=UPI0022E94372|nr:uncharacterized protein LOC128218285 isoform X2 [Mya arenaria]
MADEQTDSGSGFLLCISSIFIITIVTFILLRIKRKRNALSKEIIVFTRYPIPGKAKTRLIPALGPKAAARLQVIMTEHVVNSLQRVYHLDWSTQVTLQYNGGRKDQMEYWLSRKLCGMQCNYRQQAEGDLGTKLKSAVKDSFSRGNENVFVIGADIPGIDVKVIGSAFDTLKLPQHDMVLGPAEDGGYYLIGFSRAALKYIDYIFDEIEWGTEKVFQQQLQKAKDLNAHVAVLPYKLRDVDTEEDISVFEGEVGVSREQLMDQAWSVIIPTLNEEHNIKKCIDSVLQQATDTGNIREIVISDGGSTDNTITCVQELANTSPVPIHVVHSDPGRGSQLIAGTEQSTGEKLLFLHADTRLPHGYDTLALNCLSTPGVVAGAFRFQLDILAEKDLQKKEPWWFILQMKGLTWGTCVRGEKHELPYGDQCLFLDRRTYRHVGGFPPFRLMEDYAMVQTCHYLVILASGYAAL